MARLDKFIWSVRISKTRAIASDWCKTGRVKVNGVEAKSSREIKSGDIIELRKDNVNFKYKVIDLLNNRVSAKEVSNYLENLTSQEELNKLLAPKESIFLYRDRGAGRPTKKERRDMDSLLSYLEVDDE
jgi:ribosome-associated heat shock protein Hsp15